MHNLFYAKHNYLTVLLKLLIWMTHNSFCSPKWANSDSYSLWLILFFLLLNSAGQIDLQVSMADVVKEIKATVARQQKSVIWENEI